MLVQIVDAEAALLLLFRPVQVAADAAKSLPTVALHK
jgi:hypothetical protein